MTTSESTELKFENNDVSVTIHRKPASRVEFEMHVSSSIVKEARKEAIREVAKEAVLPGFRKGRAPQELVEKHYPQQVDQRWQEAIAGRSLKEGEALSKIAPLSRNTRINFNMKKHDIDTGADLTISFESEPFVPSINPKELEIKKVDRPTVDDAKIEETIRQSQFYFASWKAISDRAVQEGDLILLDVDDMDATPPVNVFSHVRFEVVKGKMSAWMFDLVLGKNLNESVEGVSVADESSTEEEKNTFKPKKVRVTIRAIEHAELPPLDDDFAKKLGVGTITELREQISRILNKQADAHVQEKLREQVSEQLLVKYPFDLPYTLVERETQFRMRHLLQDPQFQEEWAKMPETEHQKMIMAIFEQAQKAVRMFYICRKVAEEANISVSPQDIPPPPTSTLEALLHPSAAQSFGGGSEVQQAEAFSRILLEKTEDYLIANSSLSS